MCAVYAMSDLHGCYEKYMQMLDQIAFSTSDHLYIVGDIVDRNPGAMDIMLDVMERENVTLLLGNHEHMMLDYLNMSCPEMSGRPLDFLRTKHTRTWLTISGGSYTMEGFQKLNHGAQSAALNYLIEECPLFLPAIHVKERSFQLFHNSPAPAYLLNAINPQGSSTLTALQTSADGSVTLQSLQALEDQELAAAALKRILWERLDRNAQPESDLIYIYGHTPVFQYDETYDDGNPARIWHDRHRRKFNLDCGLAPFMGVGQEKGRLGCLRLDDLREFYAD